MNNERETKTINTPNGTEVVLYTYATGREVRAIEAKYLGSVKVDIEKGDPVFKDFDTSGSFEAEKELLKFLIVSVKGIKENCLDIVLDMPSNEYEFIVSQCNEITKKKI